MQTLRLDNRLKLQFIIIKLRKTDWTLSEMKRAKRREKLLWSICKGMMELQLFKCRHTKPLYFIYFRTLSKSFLNDWLSIYTTFTDLFTFHKLFDESFEVSFIYNSHARLHNNKNTNTKLLIYRPSSIDRRGGTKYAFAVVIWWINNHHHVSIYILWNEKLSISDE